MVDRPPLTFDESMWRYGVAYEDSNGTVLDPAHVWPIIDPFTGHIKGYRYEPPADDSVDVVKRTTFGAWDKGRHVR